MSVPRNKLLLNMAQKGVQKEIIEISDLTILKETVQNASQGCIIIVHQYGPVESVLQDSQRKICDEFHRNVKLVYAGESCIDQPGTCTRISNCQPLLDEIKKVGSPIPKHFHVRLMKRSCGFEGNEPLVCCTPSSDDSMNSDDTTMDALAGEIEKIPDTVPDPGTMTRSGLDIPDIQNHRNLHLLPTRTCGVEESFRILEGNRTGLLEMPWMVLLTYDTPRGRRSSCGGTLINERYVLTAAHCVVRMGSKKFNSVILGEWDTRKDPDCEGFGEELQCVPSAKNVTVEAIIVHQGYSRQTLHHDIALLRLSEPADVNSARIRPVCLPVTYQLQNEDLSSLMGVVAGWGATDDGLQSPVLLYAELPIVGNRQCQDAYQGSPPIHDSQICAGGVINKDTCAGDSGGPLLYFGNVGTKGTRYVQRGIVSYGSRTCGIGLPSVYTRTAYYMDWILDNIHE